MNKEVTVIVLLGHGSRVQEANEALAEVGGQVSALLGNLDVKTAYLQMARPDLTTALEQCVGSGHQRIAVVPFFLFAGAHVREDIPGIVEEFSRAHPHVAVHVADVLGGHPKLAEAAAQRAREVMA